MNTALVQCRARRVLSECALTCLALSLACSAEAAALTAGDPVVLENTKGNFDFIRIDPTKHRLLLAHTGNKTLDVFDLDSRHLLKSIATGAAQDSAVDPKHGRYYASVSAPPRMAIVDADKLEMTGEVPLPAAADLMAFNPANGQAYVCNDEAGELWVINPETKKITKTITFSGKGMEDLIFAPDHQRLFQAVKNANVLSVVDVANYNVVETWTTAPATNPHGIALVPEAETILIAGGNGKLALMNRSTGKVLASADIAGRVDELAYDPSLHIAYCGSGQNRISVVKVDADKLTGVGEVPTPASAKSIVVDPKTHVVWIAYSKDEKSFVHPFSRN